MRQKKNGSYTCLLVIIKKTGQLVMRHCASADECRLNTFRPTNSARPIGQSAFASTVSLGAKWVFFFLSCAPLHTTGSVAEWCGVSRELIAPRRLQAPRVVVGKSEASGQAAMNERPRTK